MKEYRISWLPIISFMACGLAMLLLSLLSIEELLADFVLLILSLPVISVFIGYSCYLFCKRRQGCTYYWNEEGIVIDLNGNKVYWEEIEEITYDNVQGLKSTVIRPHYTYHEKIRERRSKIMPTTAHSIDWFLIERPKEYHQHLMNSWEEKQKKKISA